jgi:glycosyltransferase involved in cell wall biosynthesis
MDLDLIIPTYNRADLLKKCLDSVCRAVRPNGLSVTVYVVDNNSQDNTRAVTQDFLAHQSPSSNNLKFKYLFVSRAGKSAALNETLAQSSGRLVGLIDDDEELDTSWFEVAHREFTEDSALEYIGGPYFPNWEIAQPLWLPQTYTGILGIVPRPARVPFSSQFHGMLMGGNTVIRRSTLQKVLPYPEHLGKIEGKIRSGEDEVIYHRLLELEAKGVVVPDLIIYHWIPAARLTKPYYRKWVIGRGISMGSQLRERGFSEPAFLGIPRYKFGSLLKSLTVMLTGSSQEVRFTAQLSILDCFATLYGRHFY